MTSTLTMLLAVASAQALPPWMTGESQPADLAVSVVTFSPGDSLVEWWGHTAVVIEDRKLQRARLYNFGMFGPKEGDTVGFVKDFIKGRLDFWVAEDAVTPTFNFYRQYLDRDVRLQELDLEPSEALAVAKRLGTHVLPENRVYRYHHYRDNCSTRPRDIVDEAIGGQLKAATSGPARMTFRSHAARYARVNPPMAWFLDFLQSGSIDPALTQSDEAYLPDELERQLASLQVHRADGSTRPLVRKQWIYYQSARSAPAVDAPHWEWLELLIGLLFVGVAHALGHWGRDGKRAPRILLGLYTSLLGLVLGLAGTGVAFMMTFTDHDVTFRNENVLQANPLTLALIPLGFMLMRGSTNASVRNRQVWTVLAALSAVGLVISPFTVQANANVLAVLVPVNVGFAALWWLQARHEAKRSSTTS